MAPLIAMESSSGTKNSSSQGGSDGGSGFVEGLGNVLLRLVPLAVAGIAYAVAGTTRGGPTGGLELEDVQNLLRFSISLITGIVTYVVISELTLRRLPRRLSKEVALLKDEIDPLKIQIAAQLETLAGLRELETFYDPDEALDKARALQSSARKRVEAMWTLVPYDDALKDYFAETLALRIYTSRIVSTHAVSREDLLDHIERSWEHLAAGRYEIHLVRECNYEALVVDRTNAGLFFYSDRGFGSCFMSSTSTSFLGVVQGLIETQRTRPEWRVPVEPNAPTTDLDRVRTWVHDFYSSHHPDHA